jgi:hypothetical protein
MIFSETGDSACSSLRCIEVAMGRGPSTFAAAITRRQVRPSMPKVDNNGFSEVVSEELML